MQVVAADYDHNNDDDDAGDDNFNIDDDKLCETYRVVMASLPYKRLPLLHVLLELLVWDRVGVIVIIIIIFVTITVIIITWYGLFVSPQKVYSCPE